MEALIAFSDYFLGLRRPPYCLRDTDSEGNVGKGTWDVGEVRGAILWELRKGKMKKGEEGEEIVFHGGCRGMDSMGKKVK